MFIEGYKLYWVLTRCKDLFPEWEDKGDYFLNKITGERVSIEKNKIDENRLTLPFNYSDIVKEI